MGDVFIAQTPALSNRPSAPSENTPLCNVEATIYRRIGEYGPEAEAPSEPVRADGNVQIAAPAAGAPINVGADVQVYAPAPGGAGGSAPVAGGDHSDVRFSGAAGGAAINNSDSYVATPAVPSPAMELPEVRSPVRNSGEGPQFFRGGPARHVSGDTFIAPVSDTPTPHDDRFGGIVASPAMGAPAGGGGGDLFRPVTNESGVRFSGAMMDLNRDAVVHQRAQGAPAAAEPVVADGGVQLAPVGEPVQSDAREQRFMETGEPLNPGTVEQTMGAVGKPLRLTSR